MSPGWFPHPSTKGTELVNPYSGRWQEGAEILVGWDLERVVCVGGVSWTLDSLVTSGYLP